MDLSFSPEEEAFRQEVREWIDEAMPDDLREKAEANAQFSMPEVMRWHEILYEKGWVAPHWPKKHGGAGMDPTRRFILNEELELAGTPTLSPFGLSMVGPLLMQFGRPDQKALALGAAAERADDLVVFLQPPMLRRRAVG